MKINKKFILVLLFIFLELNLKFIHGSKNKIKKTKKNRRGFKSSVVFSSPAQIITPPVGTLDNIKNDKYNLMATKEPDFQYLFEIDEDIIDKGAEFYFKLKEQDVFKNKERKEGEYKLKIGNLHLFYFLENNSDLSDFDPNQFQKFINNHISDLLILFMVKSFLFKDNINLIFEDKKLTKAAIKFKSKYDENAGYAMIKMLENNLDLYKKILLMGIMNILEDKKEKNNVFTIWFQKMYHDNKFYNNNILKKEFSLQLKKIESINKNFDAIDDQSILYMLILYIHTQSKDFFKFMLDKNFLKFMLLSINLKDKDKNEKIEQEKTLSEVLNETSEEKQNKIKKEFEQEQFAGIMKYSLTVLESVFKY